MLNSGKSCISALKKLGYHVIKFDPKFLLINDIKKKPDVIFNALHGKNGEDGKVQSIFEYLKIPYTHSGVISSMIAMNKYFLSNYLSKIKLKHQTFSF